MDRVASGQKGPVSQETIFRVMMFTTFGVASIFLLKNVIGKSLQGAVLIGVCLTVFGGMVLVMQKMHLSAYWKQFVISIALVFLVFVISLNSGEFYSDDFPLYLATLGLTGLYLEPQYTKYQIPLITVLMGVLYMAHPEKADPLPQYIMCVVLLDVAAFTIYMIIKRGRSFIEISDQKARESQRLLDSIQTTGKKLRDNYEHSSARLDSLGRVSDQLTENTSVLTKGAEDIRKETDLVETTCESVRGRIHTTEAKVDALNDGVKKVEQALALSQSNMENMDRQMKSVNTTVQEASEVFARLQEQIRNISTATGQLSGISFNTKILALNASIEAARAGTYGAGFSVVASEVQSLATESERCSEQIVRVVENMKKQIEITTGHLMAASQEIHTSLETLLGLEQGFTGLRTQFGELYANMEEQNVNITRVEADFTALKDKVGQMRVCSENNSTAVTSIVEAMCDYQAYMQAVIDDSRQIHDLSASMMAVSRE